MKATTTLFTVSFVSAVAAGWSHLDAVQEENGPDEKPALTKVTLDGNQLAVGVDRERVKAGDTVHLSLQMLSGKAGEVRVMVQEQSMMMDSRMEPPAQTISSQIVEVGPETATLPIELAGAFHGEGADPLLSAGSARRYTLVISSDTDGSASAALPVFAYEPEAYELRVEAPTAGGAGEPCELTVRVTNKTDKELKGISVGLVTSFMSISETPTVASLEAGGETTVTIKGTRLDGASNDLEMIQAYGSAQYGGTSAAWAKVDTASGKVASRGTASYDMLAYGYGYGGYGGYGYGGLIYR